MDFASSHYKVHVEVIGVASEELTTRAPVWPTLSMSGLSSMTNFSNNACGSIVTYYPETENNAEKHTMLARFNIMRHTDHENVNRSHRCQRQKYGSYNRRFLGCQSCDRPD